MIMEKEIMEKLFEELLKNLNIEKDNDGNVTISSNASVDNWTDVEFDDSLTKESVQAYKDVVDVLDSDTFRDYLNDLSTVVDLDTFNKLLDLDKYSTDEADAVEEMIYAATIKLKKILKGKVERYNDAIGLCNAILD